MLNDPQIITVNAVAQSMPRIQMQGTSSTYQKADQTFSLDISHTTTKDGRVRSMAKVTQRKVVADPLTSENDYDNLVFYIVLDRPGYGFSDVEAQQLVTGFKTWLDNAMVTKLYGKES
jgi:hypothetical protein